MAILPNGIDSKLQTADEFAQRFVSNATSIGLTQQEADDFAAFVGNTEDARNTATLLRNQTKLAFATQNIELDEMSRQFGVLVGKIKGFANASADPKSVYTLSGVPMPKTPEPRPAPDAPTALEGVVNSGGGVDVKWQGALSFGVSFILERRLTPINGAPGNWSPLATVQAKSFTDNDVPVGNREVSYRVKAMRNELASDWTDGANVMFGQPNETSSSSSSSVSMAA